MSSYADDIQRIAKQKAIKGGLGDLENRAPISGTVTPFIDEAIAPPSTGSSPEDVVPEASDPEDPNSYNKGDGSGGGGGSGSSNTSGTQSADDIIEDKAGPTLPDSPADGSTEPSNGGSLDGIDGLVDCDTGQGVNVRLNGEFPVHSGWDDPDVPPPPEGFESGYFWESSPIAIYVDFTPELCLEQFKLDSPTATITGIDIDTVDQRRYRYYLAATPSFDQSILFVRGTCTPGSYSTYCPEIAPAATEWPTDGNYDLTLKDGQFQSSQYDSEAPTSAKEPRSAINLCTTGGKNVTIRAAANGGSMMYETSGGAPTGTMKVFNSDGTMRMAGDATNTNINSQLPR
jgi:hypothetical protein